MTFVHHDRIKPCNDSSYPLWLQRKRHLLLDTLPTDDGEDWDMEPEEPSQDNFPDGGLFDPDQTLPYMLGDDPDMTLHTLFDKSTPSEENDMVESTANFFSDPSGDSDSDSDTTILSEPKTTRAGRKIQLPARYRD